MSGDRLFVRTLPIAESVRISVADICGTRIETRTHESESMWDPTWVSMWDRDYKVGRGPLQKKDGMTYAPKTNRPKKLLQVEALTIS